MRIEMAQKFKEAYFVIAFPKWPLYAALGTSFFSAALGTISFVITRIKAIMTPKEKDLILDNPELAILALSDEEHSPASSDAGEEYTANDIHDERGEPDQ